MKRGTKRVLLTGNGAAAWGARLARVDHVSAFPITPQTEIIESLAEWIDNGEMPGRLVTKVNTPLGHGIFADPSSC